MKLNQYIFSQLSITFFPIFFGLFFITSIVFLVKIAALTSVVTINVFELFTMYAYTIPNIIFYTLPISFFISLVIALAKLSSEYELIVITSFGLKPTRILRVFLPVTFLLSIALLIVSLGLIPKTRHLTEQMMTVKKKEANFNIKSSEFGQKFGDWMIYIEDKKENTYSEVKLFKTQDNADQFIVSKTATMQNQDGDLNFLLNNGKLFHFKPDEINQIDFEKMTIADSVNDSEFEIFTDSFNYWKDKIKRNDNVDKFTFYILVSIFPFISLFLVIAFGYYNPRYEKNRSVAWSVLFIVLYYVAADFLAKKIQLNALYVIPPIWMVLCYYVYQRNVKKVY